MRQFLRLVSLVFVLLALGLSSSVPAQQSAAETLSEEALSKLSDLQSAAQQLAQQQGQFAGRSIGPQFASATNQLLQVLLNFDVWACGTSVTALHLKRQRLAVAAAAAQPPDPALDRAVDDFGRLISQLQELCDRHVHRIYGDPKAGGGTGTTPQPPVEESPPPPRMSVQERICYDRCHELYNQFVRAEFDYDRALRDAQRDRQRASDARRDAGRAAQRSATARQQVEQTRRDYDRLQAAMSASRNQGERLRIAEQLSHLNPDSARQMAENAQREADNAARAAQQAEARAARSEAAANALYDAMMEIYQAWERCARACAEQARLYDRVTIDPHQLFPGMPASAPRPPPFYRPAPPPQQRPAQQASVPLDRASAEILAIHNAERAAVRVRPLRWDPALQASAAAYAQQLARTGRLVHSPRTGRAIERENLSQGMIGWTPRQMLNNWTREKRDFVTGIYPNVTRTGRWQDVSHYTQMVWPATTSIGCGMATGSGYQWLVCRYSPGGNKDGNPVGLVFDHLSCGPGDSQPPEVAGPITPDALMWAHVNNDNPTSSKDRYMTVPIPSPCPTPRQQRPK